MFSQEKRFRTADEVRAYLPQLNDKINMASMIEPLKKRRMDLINLQQVFYHLEQKAYQEMGFNNLDQFQKEIDSINESGLKELSAKALSNWRIIRKAREATYDQAEFEKALQQWIQSNPTLRNTLAESAVDEIFSESAFDLITEQLYLEIKGLKKLGSRQRGGLTAFRKHFQIRGKDLVFSSNLKALGAYKKKIAAVVGAKKKIDGSITFQIEANYEDISNDQYLEIKAYPYFAGDKPLTREELDNKKVWDFFKQELGKLAPRYKRIIMDTVEEMGPSAFIAYNENDIKGIFGELQLLVILNVIGWRKKKAKFTGHMRNNLAGSAKIGIDALLDEIGFQVKNYSGYYKDNDFQGINLHHNWTLSYFLSKIQELPTMEIGDFYALSSFHQQQDKSFADVTESFKSMELTLKQAYIGFIDRFLPFSEQVQIEDLPETTMRNLFWFIGGDKIVPTSKIIGAYLNRLKAIIKQAQNDRGLAVNPKYKGMTYKSYLSERKKRSDLDMPSLEEIQKNIYIAMTINFHLPSLLQELK